MLYSPILLQKKIIRLENDNLALNIVGGTNFKIITVVQYKFFHV